MIGPGFVTRIPAGTGIGYANLPMVDGAPRWRPDGSGECEGGRVIAPGS